MTAGKPTSFAPELRFPEFRNSGDWHFRPLKEIAEPVSDRVGTAVCVPMSVTTGVGLVSQEEKFGRTIAGDSYKNYIRLQRNDFAYNKSSTKDFPQGYIARYSGTNAAAVPNSIFTCFRPDTAAVVPEYLDHLFHGNHHGRWLRKYITVGARAHGALSVGDDDLMSMPVPLPPDAVLRREQQKIADCLASVGALIEAQRRKVEALKAQKKGLMQQLFPQEGKTQPSLRFPEFRNAGDWREESVSSCLQKVIDYRGKAPPKSAFGVPLITAKNVRFGWLDLSNNEYIETEQYDAWMSRGIPQAGDVLFTTEAPLGNVALFPRSGKFAVGQRLLTLRSNPRKCLPDFLFQSLLGPEMQGQIDYHSTGSTAKGIMSAVFLKLTFIYPKDAGEQKRIADCLTSLDEVIAAETQKLGTFKTNKKGLMQQLFPAAEEAGA